ncbi:hypothetical protein K435DRAFT_673953 [Dendrothele bispora CBS 962.96]|uniref:CUE domain-containing protein n=1 Tax=Dendrothele bispora (strain CBS 962.96) TaxID=1314807 RepID=A0A4S8LQ15_DENBC|nr:hypothetical protein K435DRAFT_673953 [Dendrothele bispora CBS 962.96]
MAIEELPPYPSTQSRKSLSPSQLAILNQKIASCLSDTLSLPTTKYDNQSTRLFIATYASDAAFQTLQSLIWEPDILLSRDEKIIRKSVLQLAERLAASLDVQTLIDLAVTYGSTNTSRMRSIFMTAFETNSSLSNAGIELLSAFMTLLESDEALGLYNLRKSAHCISNLLSVSPPEILQAFTHSKDFYLAMAKSYDQRLTSIAHSYGGLSAIQNAEGRELAKDDWERIWLETKVAFMDCFHVCISFLVKHLASSSGQNFAVEAERAFDIVFGLLHMNSPTSDILPTPFLNQSLLTDYQRSYDLTGILSSSLRRAEERDARLDLLESTLSSSAGDSNLGTGSSTQKNPGVLKILLRSSGAPVGIDNLGKGKHVDKGKAKEIYLNEPTPSSSSRSDPDLEMKASQVLDIFPDQPIEYIKLLLSSHSYPFHGNPEKVIEALLEGTAPPHEELLRANVVPATRQESYSVKDRHNIFDDEDMDLSKLRIGKKAEDEKTLFRDRAFIEQMKTDILRRAEQISEDENEDGSEGGKQDTFAFEDDVELDGHVKVAGDGEQSEDEDGEDDAQEGKSVTPETILELAYIRDQKLFDRDANTRRSKGRAELKAQTGWSNEQIEGWKIMLERNPKKEQILQKHEFSGNKRGPVQSDQPTPGSSRGRGGRDSRGSRGSRGRGRGGGGSNDARDRAWKDKNKASRANHNRKSGHDKKMARVGGPG